MSYKPITGSTAYRLCKLKVGGQARFDYKRYDSISSTISKVQRKTGGKWEMQTINKKTVIVTRTA